MKKQNIIISIDYLRIMAEDDNWDEAYSYVLTIKDEILNKLHDEKEKNTSNTEN